MSHTAIFNLSISIKKPLLTFNLKYFLIFTFILLLSLSAFYVFQINAVVSKSYQIQDIQKRINEVLGENKTLEASVIKTGSLEKIEDKIKTLGFEKVQEIHYLRIFESAVAKSKELTHQ